MTSLPLSVQVNFWVDLMISNRHVHIVSALGQMKSSGSGDDIGQTRQWLDFRNSSFETYYFSVLFLSLFLRENFLNPNHRRPQKKKKEIRFTNFVTQCNPPVPSLWKILTNTWHFVENHPFRLLSKITKSDSHSLATGQKSFKDIQYPGRSGRDVPTSRTLHSQLPPLFLGFLSPISPLFSKHLKSKVPF